LVVIGADPPTATHRPATGAADEGMLARLTQVEAILAEAVTAS
jgi:hypothetical protein